MERLKRYADALNKNGFQTEVVATAAEAREALLKLIPEGASVGFGGSMTIRDLDVYDHLAETGHAVYWHWMKDPSVFKDAQFSDVYLASANAILEKGHLLNVDGTGNRVSSMFFGPKRVVIVAGKNKLCGDYEDASARIRREACPPNAKRLNRATPCAVGKCLDCRSPERMCNITVLMERPSSAVKDVHVILVNEDLGF